MNRLTVISLILILFLLACGDKKSPNTPTNYANVVLSGDPIFYWGLVDVGMDWIQGKVINIGTATAYNVKITFHFYRSESAKNHFKSLFQYTKPAVIAPSQKASYNFFPIRLGNYTGDDGKIWYTTEITWD